MTRTTEDWDEQEAGEAFLLQSFVCGDIVYDDFAQWEREVGTWEELKERLLLSDAYWEPRVEDDGYDEIVALTRAGMDPFDAMMEVWSDESYGAPWWSWRKAQQQAAHALDKFFTAASAITKRRQRWLWDRRIPRNEITLLAGLQGRGKSALTMFFIAGVTRGSFGNRPADVVLFSAEEDPETTIVVRLEAAGADLERVHVYTIEKHFAIRRDVALLEKAVEHWKVGLIVVDPIMSFLDDDTDQNNAKEVRETLHALNYLKKRSTILATIHFRKEAASEVLHMVTSSSAFSEVPRAALALGKEPESADGDGRLALVHVKCNVGKMQKTLLVQIEEAFVDDPEGGPPLETSRVVVGVECDLTQDQVFKQHPAGRKPVVRTELEALLSAELVRGGGTVSVRQMKKKFADLGSYNTLTRAKDALGLVATWDDEEGGWIWREPDLNKSPE